MRPIIIKFSSIFALTCTVVQAQTWQSQAEAENAIQQIKDHTVILDRQYAESQKSCQESFFVYACQEKAKTEYEQKKRANTLLESSAQQYLNQIKAYERLERIATRESEYQKQLAQPVAARKAPESKAPTAEQQQQNTLQFDDKQLEAQKYAVQQAQRRAEAEQKRLQQIAEREEKIKRYQEITNQESPKK